MLRCSKTAGCSEAYSRRRNWVASRLGLVWKCLNLGHRLSRTARRQDADSELEANCSHNNDRRPPVPRSPFASRNPPLPWDNQFETTMFSLRTQASFGTWLVSAGADAMAFQAETSAETALAAGIKSTVQCQRRHRERLKSQSAERPVGASAAHLQNPPKRCGAANGGLIPNICVIRMGSVPRKDHNLTQSRRLETRSKGVGLGGRTPTP
jgi:hypothetical protein